MLLLGGLVLAVAPGFWLARGAGPCGDFGANGLTFARLSIGQIMPIPVVQNCWNSGPLFVFFLAGFVVSSIGALVLLSTYWTIRTVTFLTGAALTITLAMPFVPNTDPYAYALYAYEGFALKQSPYFVHPLPHTSQAAATLAALFPATRNPLRVTTYGPMSTAVSVVLIGPFAMLSLKAMIIAERILGAVLTVVLALLIASTRETSAGKRLAFAAIALNPLILFETVSFAHGDVVMLVLLALAYKAYRSDRLSLCAAACVLATETRSVAVAAMLALLVSLVSAKRYSATFATVIAAGITTLAACALSQKIFGTFAVSGHFFFTGANTPVTALIALFAGNSRRNLIVGLALEAAIGVLIIYVAARQRRFDVMPIGVLAGLPGVEPWYAQWVAPIAATTRDAPYRNGLISFMLLAPLQMGLEMVAHSNDTVVRSVTVAALWGIPLLVYYCSRRAFAWRNLSTEEAHAF